MQATCIWTLRQRDPTMNCWPWLSLMCTNTQVCMTRIQQVELWWSKNLWHCLVCVIEESSSLAFARSQSPRQCERRARTWVNEGQVHCTSYWWLMRMMMRILFCWSASCNHCWQLEFAFNFHCDFGILALNVCSTIPSPQPPFTWWRRSKVSEILGIQLRSSFTTKLPSKSLIAWCDSRPVNRSPCSFN